MHRAIRPIAVMLGFMFVVAAPARASSVTYSDVEQTVAIGRSNNAIRLRMVTPQDMTISGVTASDTDTNTTSNTPQTNPVTETMNIVPAAVIASQDGGNVQEIQVGDVTGTICDCGEIFIPRGETAGGFPKYPLLALGVIPFLFLNRDGDRTPITIPPTIPPTPVPTPPIPEPATIILLGSGLAALGAGARRRRRAQADKLDELGNATVAEEV
ncbi:MAG: PEP-CTERM sorting domain-containing protein [Pyrinomonadaceae bacterium MAG19_C2-C3]|nr:PEP-CTERM sorting domain-containing protein [Pyrinomonadaceae bacterium MAG19_C2-C3]